MITALIAPLTCLHFNADKTLASPEDLQTENVRARGGKRSLLTHHHYNHHQSIWLRRWHCHLAGFRRPLYAATLSSLLGICHSFHLLGKEEGGGGRLWSHNLLEIYPIEINFISSHTQSVSQLNLCPATFRVTVIPMEDRAGWTAGRLSCRQQRPKYLINQPICHLSLTVKYRPFCFSINLLPLKCTNGGKNKE